MSSEGPNGYHVVHTVWEGILTLFTGSLFYGASRHSKKHDQIDETLLDLRHDLDTGPDKDDVDRLERKLDQQGDKMDKLYALILQSTQNTRGRGSDGKED